jgi:hypothetical protein
MEPCLCGAYDCRSCRGSEADRYLAMVCSTCGDEYCAEHDNGCPDCTKFKACFDCMSDYLHDSYKEDLD